LTKIDSNILLSKNGRKKARQLAGYLTSTGQNFIS